MIHLGEGPVGIIFFGTLCASCSWIAVSFFTSVKSSVIVASNTFLILFSFFHLGSHLCTYRPIGLIYGFFFPFIFLCCSDQVIPIILSSRSRVCFSALSNFLCLSKWVSYFQLDPFLQVLFPFYNNMHFYQWPFLIPSIQNIPLLNSESGTLVRSVSQFVLSGEFSQSFNLEWCFFIFLVYL